MAKLKQEISIRTEEIQDIMSKVPNNLIRLGLSGMFLLIVLVLFLCWFIKYPEISAGKITLTTSVEPVKLVSQSSGVVIKLNVKDGDVVPAGKVLAEIENPLSASAVDYMLSYVTKLDNALEHEKNELPLPDTTLISFGDLQSVLNGLMKELLIFNISSTLKMDDVEINSIRNKIENQKQTIVVNDRIIALTKSDVEDSKIKFDANTKLYKENFISKMEFLQSESDYRAKELSLEQMNQSRINHQNILDALELQYKQAEFSKYNKVKTNLDAIRGYIKSIRSYIFGWQQKYNLIAMKAGTVNFLQRIQVGIFLKGGEELFAITEPGGMYLGVANVPAIGYGKIKIGQNVNIFVQNYPYYEYGILKGIVNNIALFPNTNEYRVEILLPNGMMSSQNILLKYTPEMTGDAEIVTDDKRVLQRIFDSIIKAFKRKQ